MRRPSCCTPSLLSVCCPTFTHDPPYCILDGLDVDWLAGCCLPGALHKTRHHSTECTLAGGSPKGVRGVVTWGWDAMHAWGAYLSCFVRTSVLPHRDPVAAGPFGSDPFEAQPAVVGRGHEAELDSRGGALRPWSRTFVLWPCGFAQCGTVQCCRRGVGICTMPVAGTSADLTAITTTTPLQAVVAKHVHLPCLVERTGSSKCTAYHSQLVHFMVSSCRCHT